MEPYHTRILPWASWEMSVMVPEALFSDILELLRDWHPAVDITKIKIKKIVNRKRKLCFDFKKSLLPLKSWSAKIMCSLFKSRYIVNLTQYIKSIACLPIRRKKSFVNYFRLEMACRFFCKSFLIWHSFCAMLQLLYNRLGMCRNSDKNDAGRQIRIPH